jgi:hypothetical protein
MEEILLNPDSEYYRVCKNCNIEFMANDLREKYCCADCHNKYHRRLNRFKRASEPIISNGIIPIQAPDEKKMNELKKNIEILILYKIGREGRWVTIKELEDKGFNFEVYTSVFPVANNINKCFVEYGSFIINRETKNYLFIRTKNQ